MRELGEGWREFRSRTWPWVAVVASAVGSLVWVGGTSVLGPVVAKRALHGAAGWGIVVGAEGIGLVVAGLVALRWRPTRLLRSGTIALIGTPIFLATLAAPAPLAIVVLGGIVAGFGVELFNVYWMTTMQQQIPDEVLARVNSYDALGSFVFIPIGLTIAGPIAGAIGVSATLWAGAGIAVFTSLSALASRDVRTLRRREEQPVVVPLEAEPVPPPIR